MKRNESENYDRLYRFVHPFTSPIHAIVYLYNREFCADQFNERLIGENY